MPPTTVSKGRGAARSAPPLFVPYLRRIVKKDSVRRPIMQTSKQGTEGKRIPAGFKGHNKQRGKEVDLAKLQLEKEKLEKRQQEGWQIAESNDLNISFKKIMSFLS